MSAPLDALPMDKEFTVRGTRIVYGEAGPLGAQPVILVHGSRAHSQWWARVVPDLATEFRVAWLDLSGHGDSGRGAAYNAETWAKEVLELRRIVADDAPAVLAGHSMGGRIAITATAMADDADFRALVLLDTRLWGRDEVDRPQLRPRADPVIYPDRASAVARFRLSPEQRFDDPEMLALLADNSVHESSGGWTWKYDYRGIPPLTGDDILDRLNTVTVPVIAARGAASTIVRANVDELLRSNVHAPLRTEAVAGAGHHMIADSAAASADLIRRAVYDPPG